MGADVVGGAAFEDDDFPIEKRWLSVAWKLLICTLGLTLLSSEVESSEQGLSPKFIILNTKFIISKTTSHLLSDEDCNSMR